VTPFEVQTIIIYYVEYKVREGEGDGQINILKEVGSYHHKGAFWFKLIHCNILGIGSLAIYRSVSYLSVCCFPCQRKHGSNLHVWFMVSDVFWWRNQSIHVIFKLNLFHIFTYTKDLITFQFYTVVVSLILWLYMLPVNGCYGVRVNKRHAPVTDVMASTLVTPPFGVKLY
jgi:hypothetical protein